MPTTEDSPGAGRDRAGGGRQLEGARVIFVLGPLELGGAERQALLLARHLKEAQGADVHVWGMAGEPGRVAALCDSYGIPWRIVPLPWAPRRFERERRLIAFARILRGARPDILLPYMSLPSTACALVWRWTGARLCVWNQRDHRLSRVGTRLEPWAVRQTPVFVANSAHVAEYLVRDLGAPPARVRVVHNGVELAAPESGREEWRERLGVGRDCFLACMVANLHKDKDQATLLRAWAVVAGRAREAGRDCALLLAGRFDTTHESLKALAFDLGLCRSVRFLGQVSDVSGLLRAADLCVFSSRSEGSPNGVLECMAAGLAVVATDIPAIREAVPVKGHAALVPPGDAAAMAERILALMDDSELREELGAANRARAASEFSARRMCDEMVSVIVDGLRERARGA